MPAGISGKALLEEPMDAISVLCSPWLPEGLMILAGPPKIGKSTMARQWAHAVNVGRALWGAQCDRAAVVYLSLEEGERLMRKKLAAAGFPADELADVSFHWAWAQGAEGCADLRLYLNEHPTTKLVVIDSLSRFRAPATRERPQFQQDYDAVAGLADIAKERPGLAIVVLHHTTKIGTAQSPVEAISGTYGVAAAADSYAVLCRQGGDFVLACGGRHWDQYDDLFVVERAGGLWAMRGADDGVRLSPRQREFLSRLASEGTISTRGLATRFHVGDSTATELMGELRDKGMVERTSDGWRATAAGEAKAASLFHSQSSETTERTERTEGSQGVSGVSGFRGCARGRT
jgi:hypothetical protein